MIACPPLKEAAPLRNYFPLAELTGGGRDEKPVKVFWVPVVSCINLFSHLQTIRSSSVSYLEMLLPIMHIAIL